MGRLLGVRALLFSVAGAGAIALAACGGGGGGGGGGTVPSASSTPAATPTPTLAPTAAATSAALNGTSSTSVQFGAVSNGTTNEVSSAALSIPATGVATTATLNLSGSAPASVTVPSLRSMSRKASSLGIQSTIAYFTLQFQNDVTIAQSPTFSISLPFTATGNWYVLFEDGSGVLTPQGWSEVAQLNVGTNGTSLSLTTATPFSPPMTLKANTKYYFAIVTTGSGPISTPTTAPTPSATINPAAIPMGMTSSTQGKWSSTTPQVGYIYSCQSTFNGAGNAGGPWINYTNLTWNSTTKSSVSGSVTWSSTYTVGAQSGSSFTVSSNDEPLNETTGVYPIASSDPAYAYDQNPNSIAAQQHSWILPWSPTQNSTPTCLPMGSIGVTTDGVVFYNGLDAKGRDAAAFEVVDSCGGHPSQGGIYHYHSLLTSCLTDTKDTDGHSGLYGYAWDGFGIYGPDGVDGSALVDSDLDECHGHTHTVLFHGVEQNIYHYHVTTEFPYTLGCYRGTPITSPF